MVNITTTDLDNPEYYIQRHKKGWKIVHSKSADKLIKKHGKGILKDKTPSLIEFSKADQKKLIKANVEGGSILSSVLDTVKHYTNKVKDVAHKVVHGRGEDYPPNAKLMIEKYKNETVVGVSLHRSTLSSVYTTLMSALTNGETARRLLNEPKDKLFHISMWVKLSNGVVLSCEKEEAIKIRENPKKKAREEEQDAPVPQNTTFEKFLLKGLQNAGAKKFFGYSAKDNNCGNWIEYILRGNNIDNASTHAFIGQDTKKILAGFPNLRKFMNTITDIGGRANVVAEGGKIAKMRGGGDREPPPPPPPSSRTSTKPRRNIVDIIKEMDIHEPKSKKGAKIKQEIQKHLEYIPKITDAPKVTQRKRIGKGLKHKMVGGGDREPPPPPPPRTPPRRPREREMQYLPSPTEVNAIDSPNFAREGYYPTANPPPINRREVGTAALGGRRVNLFNSPFQHQPIMNPAPAAPAQAPAGAVRGIFDSPPQRRQRLNTPPAAGAEEVLTPVSTPHNQGGSLPDWDNLNWGSLTKQFERYNSQHKPLKDLEAFAKMIIAEPKKYLSKTVKRARFYINVILKKKSHNIEMPHNRIMGKGVLTLPTHSAIELHGDKGKIITTMPIAGMPQYTDPRPMLGGDPRTWSPHPLHTQHPNASIMSLGGSGLYGGMRGGMIEEDFDNLQDHDFNVPENINWNTTVENPQNMRVNCPVCNNLINHKGLPRHYHAMHPEYPIPYFRPPHREGNRHGRGSHGAGMRGGVIPSPPSRNPTTDPSLM